LTEKPELRMMTRGILVWASLVATTIVQKFLNRLYVVFLTLRLSRQKELGVNGEYVFARTATQQAEHWRMP
jgi:hypothetical protein